MNSRERGLYISHIQRAVLKNEKKRFNDTSSFLNALNKSIEESFNDIYLREYQLKSRPDSDTDVGLLFRLEMIKNLKENLRSLKKDLNNVISESGLNHLEGVYNNTYRDISSSIGLKGLFALPNREAVIESINYPWSGMMWSDRVWKNTDKVTREVERLISKAILTGNSSVNIAKKVNQNLIQANQRIKYVTERIIRTETARVRYNAESRMYKDMGVNKVEFCAIIDSKTSRVCRETDGKIFKLGDEPMIPLHPHCRSTYLPVVGERNMDDIINRIKEARGEEVNSSDRKIDEKIKPFAEKVLYRDDSSIEVRGKKYGLGKMDMEYVKKYESIKSYDELIQFKRQAKDLVNNGEVSYSFYKFIESMEESHEIKESLKRFGGYKYALTSYDVEKLEKRLHKKGFFDRLTDDEIEAMNVYSGSDYRRINEHLRGIKPIRLGGLVKKTIPDLVSGLSKGKLEEDMVLFRGASLDIFDNKFLESLTQDPKSVIGQKFKDEGFMSTSIMGGSAFKSDLSFRILAPKGTEGVYIKEFSDFKSENEFLLQKGYEMEIVDVIKKGNEIDEEYVFITKLLERK